MGRGKPTIAAERTKKPKTAIELKREERRAKKALPRPAPIPTTTSKLPKDNPAFTKWTAYFQKAITTQETTIKVLNRVQDHMRMEMDKMVEEERKKYENGETSNWPRLQFLLLESKAALLRVREASAWILPPKRLGENKSDLGMKGLVLGADTEEKGKRNGATNGTADSSSDEEPDMMDTDENVEDEDSSEDAPAYFIPLDISKNATASSENDSVRKKEDTTAKEAVEQNPYFMVDTNPTPVNMNGASKKGKKRAKEDDGEEHKAAKKSKKEKTAVVLEPQTSPTTQPHTEPKSKSKTSNIDFSAIEAKLQAEIEAGQKAKADREAAKLAKKEKKRKRMSEGDSEKEVKKHKKEKNKEKKKQKAEDSGRGGFLW